MQEFKPFKEGKVREDYNGDSLDYGRNRSEFPLLTIF